MMGFISNWESYLFLAAYLFFLGYVYFITESCAQKRLANLKTEGKMKEASSFNIIILNPESPQKKTFRSKKSYKIKPRPFYK